MTTKKGIILAGGSGTRLYPVPQAASKQLMPVYDKPMVSTPSTRSCWRVSKMCCSSAPHKTLPRFIESLGDGSQWGMSIQYAIQSSPDGLSQPFVIGKDFVGMSLAQAEVFA